MFDLNGKIALITGGASGIGAATARRLTEAGASVIVADLNETEAKALAAELPGARAVTMDVTNAASIDAALRGLERLDILVNCAGIGLVGGIAQTEAADYERIMMVNATSVYLVTKAALPLLLAVRGSIVNIGSVAGLIGIKQRFAYCASKGAVIAMTRQLAVEYP
ncbi:MAG TPA: SDR family NAD(P)-dependent oxidoreductase, partial [Acidobacteriaceae bacterium]